MIDLLLIGATRFLVGGGAQWVGCEPAPRQRIYFANHGSHLDTLLIWAALPRPLRGRTHPVAAADYWGGEGALGVGGDLGVLLGREGAARRARRAAVGVAADVHRELDRLHELGARVPAEHGDELLVERQHRAIAALDRDERACIEGDHLTCEAHGERRRAPSR